MNLNILEDAFDRWWEEYIHDYEIRTDTFESFKAGAHFGYKLAEKREIKVNRLVAEIGKELGDLRISFHNSIEIIGRQLEDKKKLQEEIDTLKQTVSILKKELYEWSKYES